MPAAASPSRGLARDGSHVYTVTDKGALQILDIHDQASPQRPCVEAKRSARNTQDANQQRGLP